MYSSKKVSYLVAVFNWKPVKEPALGVLFRMYSLKNCSYHHSISIAYGEELLYAKYEQTAACG